MRSVNKGRDIMVNEMRGVVYDNLSGRSTEQLF